MPLVVASWLAIAMVTAVCPLLRLARLLTAGDMKSSLAGFDVYPPAANGTCVGCAPGDQVARWLSRKQSQEQPGYGGVDPMVPATIVCRPETRSCC